jgi:hypothetical protein
MPIKNITVRMPRAGHIRLGGAKGANSPGRNLDHFRVESGYFSPQELEAAIGKSPKELRIKFPRIDRTNDKRSLEFIFDSSYKAYKNGTLYCRGDGETASRAVKKGEIEQVSCTCEYLTMAVPLCKQRGDLKVVLAQLPFVGFFQIGTSSWNSISSIQSVIDMYYQMLGDKFWLTEFVLFKEETMLRGHRQYIMRLKIASDFANTIPAGASINMPMMFEDEFEELHEVPTPAPIETPAEKVQEPPKAEPEISEAPPEIEEAPDEPPSLPEPEEPTTTAPTNDTHVRPVPEGAAPDNQPVSSTVDGPAPRQISPQRRSKEAQLRMMAREFAHIINEKSRKTWEEGGNTGHYEDPFQGNATEMFENVIRFVADNKLVEDMTDLEIQELIKKLKEDLEAIQKAETPEF